MRRFVSLALIAMLSLGMASANAVTPKASPKPSAHPTVKVSSKKVSSKKVSTNKVTAKKSVTRKYPRRSYKRKYVKPIPSPAPSWPPANFYSKEGVYINYKVSSSALVGALSAASDSSDLYKDSQLCTSQICGVVQLGSESGCDWWEVDATIYGLVDSSTTNTFIRGTLQTFAPASSAHQIFTQYLVSPVPITAGDKVVPTKALCWSKGSGAKVPAKIPDNIYVAYPSK